MPHVTMAQILKFSLCAFSAEGTVLTLGFEKGGHLWIVEMKCFVLFSFQFSSHLSLVFQPISRSFSLFMLFSNICVYVNI